MSRNESWMRTLRTRKLRKVRLRSRGVIIVVQRMISNQVEVDIDNAQVSELYSYLCAHGA